MYRIARTAGALVAAVALGAVATPAIASSTPLPIASSTVGTAVSALPQAEIGAKFKPKKCGKRQYFRDHRFQCIRYFRYLEDRADRGRDREQFNDRDRWGGRDGRDGGFGENRRGGRGWNDGDTRLP